MRNRFLMAGLLAFGVAACGDDVEVVSPTPPVPPPPPPVTATMAPASASVAVGNSVVFAVNASGGVAGEAASWTCSSSNTGIATVSSTSAGCQATGVVAGSVTITAAVSKSGESVNVGSELTVTSDDVVGGDPAFVLITGTNAGVDGDVSGNVEVYVSVDRGDQTLAQVGITVDGEIVSYQDFGGGMMMAPLADDEPAEQAIAVEFTLSFDSAEYDEAGVPKFMNGDHVVTAGVLVEGSMEPILSNSLHVDFDNNAGVHVMADYPGNRATNPSTGEVWYGGPGGSIFTIAVTPVLFSGEAAESVGIRDFCDTDLATDTEAPYVFEIDCEGESGKETPEFVVTAGGQTLDQEQSLALNDALFPINLDFEGPTAPVFKVNPNSRQDGWINAAVNLAGENGSGSKANGWLIYYDDDDDGVGGYIPQLGYSASDPSVVASALAATRSADPALPAETDDNDDICFIVTATDLLGNESATPSASKGCMQAGKEGKVEDTGTATSVTVTGEMSGYGARVTELKRALKVVDLAGDKVTDAQNDAVTKARKDLKDAGLRVGVDVTPPTAEFVRSGLDEDSREIDQEFVVEIADTRDGSGIHTGTESSSRGGAPKAIVATLEIRDAEETRCIIDSEPSDNTRLCALPFAGLTAERGVVTTTITSGENSISDFTGYYTFTVQAQDKARNLSEKISRTAINDIRFDARASLRVNPDAEDSFEYSLDVTLDDDLSIRDYYLAASSLDADDADGPVDAPVNMRFAVDDVQPVDAFNASGFTTDHSESEDITLPFLALQGTLLLVTLSHSRTLRPSFVTRVWIRARDTDIYMSDNDDSGSTCSLDVRKR